MTEYRDELPALTEPRALPATLAGKPASGTPLEWQWAEQRLTSGHCFWIAITRADGWPHCRPVWGLWWPSGFWFVTASVAARHLSADPRVCVHLDSGEKPGDEVVIVQGRASRYRDPVELVELAHDYAAKYEWTAEPTVEGNISLGGGAPGAVYLVRPEVVFGWGSETDRATKWSFS